MNVAKGISEYGMMVVTVAFFLVITATLWIATYKLNMRMINGMMSNQKEVMASLLEETKKQNERLSDISEGLRTETILRIKNISSVFFELAAEKSCRILRKVRTENHISDKEATGEKIRTLLSIDHEDRNSKLDSFTFHGHKLSEFTDSKWIEDIAKVIERELYNEAGENNGRSYTNIVAAFDKIKLEFYHNIHS